MGVRIGQPWLASRNRASLGSLFFARTGPIHPFFTAAGRLKVSLLLNSKADKRARSTAGPVSTGPRASTRLDLPLLGLLTLLCFVGHLLTGPYALDIASLSRLLSEPLAARQSADGLVFWQLRLPRSLLTALVGCALAVAGAAMQGLFRNALADPSIIGVTSGASLGASLAIALGAASWAGASWLGLSLITLGAFGGGLLDLRASSHMWGVSVSCVPQQPQRSWQPLRSPSPRESRLLVSVVTFYPVVGLACVLGPHEPQQQCTAPRPGGCATCPTQHSP